MAFGDVYGSSRENGSTTTVPIPKECRKRPYATGGLSNPPPPGEEPVGNTYEVEVTVVSECICEDGLVQPKCKEISENVGTVHTEVCYTGTDDQGNEIPICNDVYTNENTPGAIAFCVEKQPSPKRLGPCPSPNPCKCDDGKGSNSHYSKTSEGVPITNVTSYLGKGAIAHKMDNIDCGDCNQYTVN